MQFFLMLYLQYVWIQVNLYTACIGRKDLQSGQRMFVFVCGCLSLLLHQPSTPSFFGSLQVGVPREQLQGLFQVQCETSLGEGPKTGTAGALELFRHVGRVL